MPDQPQLRGDRVYLEELAHKYYLAQRRQGAKNGKDFRNETGAILATATQATR